MFKQFFKSFLNGLIETRQKQANAMAARYKYNL